MPETDRRPLEIHSIAFRFDGSDVIPLKHHALSDIPPPSIGRPTRLEPDLLELPVDLDLGKPVPTPEYIEGERNEPAAFVMGARPKIQVIFRQLPAYADEALSIGASGNKGGVVERSVTPAFGASGLSDPVEFELASPLPQTVGKLTLSLAWSAGNAGTPDASIPIGSTEHMIYLTVDRPVAPWENETPWVDALDLSCEWGSGATDRDTAAAAITRGLNASPYLRYHGTTTFGASTFFLSSFLMLFRKEAVFHLNCTDCADMIVTLANLLGCDLHQGKVFDLETRRFLKLAGDPADDADWVSCEWNFHEMAWLHGIGPQASVYDGSLQLDTDKNDADTVHVPQLPAKMAFKNYKALLVEDGPCKPASSGSRRAVA